MTDEATSSEVWSGQLQPSGVCVVVHSAGDDGVVAIMHHDHRSALFIAMAQDGRTSITFYHDPETDPPIVNQLLELP